MDRRLSQRCPVCQGPIANGRCRKSICIYNHEEIVCPRCKKKDLESVEFRSGRFEYKCRECCHKWIPKESVADHI